MFAQIVPEHQQKSQQQTNSLLKEHKQYTYMPLLNTV